MPRSQTDPADLCHLGDIPDHQPEFYVVRPTPGHDDYEWVRRGAVVLIAVVLVWLGIIWALTK